MLIASTLIIQRSLLTGAGLSQGQRLSVISHRIICHFLPDPLRLVRGRTYGIDTQVLEIVKIYKKEASQQADKYNNKLTFEIGTMGGTGSGRTPGSGKKTGQPSGHARKNTTPPAGQTSLNFGESTSNFSMTTQRTTTSIGSIPGLNKGKKMNIQEGRSQRRT